MSSWPTSLRNCTIVPLNPVMQSIICGENAMLCTQETIIHVWVLKRGISTKAQLRPAERKSSNQSSGFPSKNHLDENYIAIVNLVKVEMFHHGRESQIVGSVEDQRDTLKNQDERIYTLNSQVALRVKEMAPSAQDEETDILCSIMFRASQSSWRNRFSSRATVPISPLRNISQLAIVPTTAKRAGVPRPLSRQSSKFDEESAAGKTERVRVERPNEECRRLKEQCPTGFELVIDTPSTSKDCRMPSYVTRSISVVICGVVGDIERLFALT
ncbi:hypothetical protein OH76DRAFT_1424054 [Lentinus brumalis]|uniref:Uncharacterized protein n=1 Tax=Lentinus brumalis TaxID=2498619 RepID=A0A371CHU9_9APHY|nr:hypothetical protein OH76DRAFT_1424054 [Polyporus brumalis]